MGAKRRTEFDVMNLTPSLETATLPAILNYLAGWWELRHPGQSGRKHILSILRGIDPDSHRYSDGWYSQVLAGKTPLGMDEMKAIMRAFGNHIFFDWSDAQRRVFDET